MTTVTITRNDTKPFRVFDVAKEITTALKDVGVRQGHINLELDGFNKNQSRAIFTLLVNSYLDLINGSNIKDRANLVNENHSTIDFGESFFEYSLGKNTAELKLPITQAGHVPAYMLEERIKDTRSMLVSLSAVKNTDPNKKHTAMPCYEEEPRNSLNAITIAIARAHNIKMKPENIRPDTVEVSGKIYPAVIIEKKIAASLCQKEGIGGRTPS